MTKFARHPRDRSFPLSSGQQRLWFLEQLDTDVPTYNCSFALRFRGPLDWEILTRTLIALGERHEALRTTFVLEKRELRQRVLPESALAASPTEIAVRSEEDVARCISDRLMEEALHRFDLLAGPAVRARLFRFSANDHALVINLHHVCTDGWSIHLLIGELQAVYEALRSGRSPDSVLPALTVQYVDFAVWEQETLTAQRLERHRQYWARELSGAPVLARLAPEERESRPPSRAGGTLQFAWPGILGDLRPIALKAASTNYMLLLAAFWVLIHGRSGQTDFLIGTVTTNRRPDFERVMGFFVNTVVIRADLSGRPTFTELLRRTRQKAIAAYAHQDLPFDEFWSCVSPGGTPSRGPLFRVAFAAENPVPQDLRFGDLRLEVIPPRCVSAKFDLTMSICERGEDLHGEIEYATDLFDRSSIAELLVTYRNILVKAAANPSRTLEELLEPSGT